MNKTTTTACLLFLFIQFAHAQSHEQTPYIVDNCFNSVTAQISFPSSFDLANKPGYEADLMEFNGAFWVGSWPNADITIKSPNGRVGCRAIFIGSGVFWTSPGEGFAMRLSQPLNEGVQYTFGFTYVSHGWGCDSAFSPKLFSNNAPIFGTEKYIMNLPAAGPKWENHLITFTATADQVGHDWLFLETDESVSSGMISSICEGCISIATSVNAFADFNPVLYPNPAFNTLYIDMQAHITDNLLYQIYNSAGQVVLSSEEKGFNNIVNISELPAGYYLLRMMSNDKVSIKPFVKSEK